MGWGAVIQAVGGYFAADKQSDAAKDSAAAQGQASDATIAEQRRQFDLMTANRQPWLDAGKNALGQMGELNSGNFSSFHESPDYQFALQQGQQGLDRGAAARGGLYSGGHTADTIKFGQGMANQQYGTFYSRLSDLATGGNATAGALGAAGMGMASNIGNAYQNTANARASSYAQQADTWGQFGAGLGGLANNYYQRNSAQNGGGTGWYVGNNPGKG